MKLQRLLFFLVALVLLNLTASAQVDVTATGGSNASYTTLKGAFDAINAGTHTGTVAIGISGNTVEGAIAALNASGAGSASYTKITITPTGGAARTIRGNLASEMLQMNGADNVTINGLNTGSNSLRIVNRNTSATSGTSTIKFLGDATGDSLLNLGIYGAATMATGTNGGVIFFSTAGGGGLGNDNNVISGCTLGTDSTTFPTKCIYSSGTTTAAGNYNSGIVVSGNNFVDYFNATTTHAAIYLSGGTSDWTISTNKFYQTGTRTQTTGSTMAAIQMGNANNSNITITGNIIGFANSGGTGTYTIAGVASTRFYPIYFSTHSTSVSSSVQNNTISSIALSGAVSGTTTSAPFAGVMVASGLVDIGSTTGNTVTNISLSSSSGTTGDFYGILNGGASAPTISNNIVTNINVTNSSTGAAVLYGVRENTSSSVSGTLSQNKISYLEVNASSTSSRVLGIANTLAIVTVNGNKVSNLRINSANLGVGVNASIIGISIAGTSTSGTYIVSQDTVHSLLNTNTTGAVAVTGIYIGHSSTGSSNVVSKNFIHSLNTSSSSTNAELKGINAAKGTTTVHNNMIRLGIDSGGTSMTNPTLMKGIYDSLTTNNYYYNTIYVGGTGVTGAANTFAFYSLVTTNTRVFRNNIFYNERSNGSGTGKHYAAFVAGTAANPAGLTINNNLYNASGTGGVLGLFNSADVTTLANWRTNVGQDANSMNINTTFTSSGGNYSGVNLHINTGLTGTQIESGGATISGINDDIDSVGHRTTYALTGQTNGGGAAPDLGADEFDGVPQDMAGPNINFTNLTNTSSTGDRTLTATIVDVTGVYLTGSFMPRIYFSKNGGTWYSDAGIKTSGTNLSGTWSFTITAATMGGVTSPDSVQYYVIAQDSVIGANNLGSKPSTGLVATDVNTVTTPPSGLPSYTITPALSGNYNIGGDGKGPAAGCTYASITEAIGAASSGKVVAIRITNAGSGYVSAPTVTISGGGGSGATATAVLSADSISYVVITNYGSGYNSTPTIGFSSGPATAVGVYSNGYEIVAPSTFSLMTTYSSSLENYPIVIPSITGTTPTNNLTIRPDAAISSNILLSTSITTGLVNFNGAKYITIDGRPGGSGDSLRLSFENTNTGTGAYTIQFINEAVRDSVLYCYVKGASSAITTGNILFSTTTTSNGNDSIGIDHCNVGDASSGTPVHGIQSLGTTTTAATANKYNSITNSNIYNFYSSSVTSFRGINIGAGNSGWTMTGNSFYQTVTRTPAVAAQVMQFIGISASTNTAGFTVSNNYFGGTAPLATGGNLTITSSTTAELRGLLFVTSNSATANSAQGNVFRKISFTSTTTSTANALLATNSGNSNIGTVSGNLFGDTAATGSITIAMTGSSSQFHVMNIANSATAGTNNVYNNVISGVTISGAVSFRAINVNSGSGTGSNSIVNNLIGSRTTANSINSSSSQVTYGVNAACNNVSFTTLITDNTIANLTTTSATNTSALIGILAAGSTGGAFDVSRNSIHHLTSASQNTSLAMAGIQYTASTTGGAIVSRNVIYSLSGTAPTQAVTILGIVYTGPTAGTNVISRNKIRGIQSTGSGVVKLYGISMLAGATTASNNEVILGLDSSDGSITKAYDVEGISETGGTNQFYFNSVKIVGSSVTNTTSTYAMSSTLTSGTRVYMNNAFSNERSFVVAGATGNYAMRLDGIVSSGAISGVTSNYNLFNANGTAGAAISNTSTTYTALTDWTTVATTHEGNSVNGDPLFGSNTSLLPYPGTALTAGSGSTGISVDINGITRTHNQMGAYDSTGDEVTPVITYNTLSNTGNLSDRTLTAAIVDFSGVPTSGGLMPRVYYKKNSGSWNSAAGTLASGSATNGTWDFNMLAFDMGGLVVGDTVKYFVVVQDVVTIPNLSAKPTFGFVATDVNTISTYPSSPNSYKIVTPLATSLNVGTGQTYTSLTGVGGLFEAVNNQVLSGNTTVSITSDILETGVNDLGIVGLAGYALTISPDAALTRVVSNASDLSQSMIRLNATNQVIFDGSFSGLGQYLRFINTHSVAGSAKPTFEIFGGCDSIYIQSSVIENNMTSTTLGNVYIGSGINTGINIKSNVIRNAQGTPGTTGVPANQVYSASSNNALNIDDNHIINFSTNGINLAATDNNSTITQNHFYYNASPNPSTSQTAILISTGFGHNIIGNFIGGSASSCGSTAWTNSGAVTFNGIQLAVNTSLATNLQGNTIKNINLTNGAGVTFNGVLISSGKVDIGTVQANNIGDGVTANSIQNAGSSATSVTCGINSTGSGVITISNNEIANLTSLGTTTSVGLRGISHTGTGVIEISGNNIHHINSSAATVGSTTAASLGVYVSSTGSGHLISGNTIYNINCNNATAASKAVGITVGTTVGTGSIIKNRVYGLTNLSSSAGAGLYGLYVNGGNWAASNNQISLTNPTYSSSLLIRGITDSSTNTTSFYNNSVFVGGTVTTGTAKTYAFYRIRLSTISLKNNIFFNGRTGGTGVHFAIGNAPATPATGWASNTSDYNLYIGSDISQIGEWGANTAQTVSQWKSSSSSDKYSWFELGTNLPSDSLFIATNTGNLKIDSTRSHCWYVQGKGVAGAAVGSLATDYEGGSRGTTFGFGTDIGSDEFTTVALPLKATASAAPAVSTTTTYTFANKTVGAIHWGAGGTPPSTIDFYYYTGYTPPNPTQSGMAPSAKYMNSVWKATATGGSGFSYDIDLYYDSALIGSILNRNEGRLKVAKKSDVEEYNWELNKTSLADTAVNIISAGTYTSFSYFAITDSEEVSGFALPITLVQFNAQADKYNTVINWSASDVERLSKFTLMRSTDGRHFTAVTTIEGQAAMSQLSNYQYTDVNIGKEFKTVYYQLEIVEPNQAKHLSEIVVVRFEDQVAITNIYPQPIQDLMNISFDVKAAGMLHIAIVDLSGKVVYQANYNASVGNQSMSINTTMLSGGCYLLQIADGNTTKVVKLIK